MTGSETSSSGNSDADQQRFRELEALHRASSCLYRLRDPVALARDIITLLKDVIHHDFAAVYLINGDRLKTFAVSDRGLGVDVLESDQTYLDSLNLKVGENVTGWVAKHGESVCLDNAREDDRFLDSQANIESELCVPMRSGDTVIGVINLESSREQAYQASDQRVLEIVANQIAIAIENGQLFERTADMERLRALADVTGGIAHDIGNMLVAMSFRCEMMQVRGLLPDSEKDELLAIRSVLDKTISVSQSLLQVGIPQHNEADFVDVNDHLRDTVLLVEALAGAELSVTFDISEDTAHVAATPGQLDQILINLVVNARQAINEKGYLVVRTRLLADNSDSSGTRTRVLLEVEDDGCGMTPETLASATQPLFTTRKDGSGLGLATVARLVAEIDGTITLESNLDAGTLVSITLPLHDNAEKVRRQPEAKSIAD